MKIVVQFEPDAASLVLDELELTDFIIDQETYCYFRDEIFIKGMEEFIKKRAPGKWQDDNVHQRKDDTLEKPDTLEMSRRVERWFDNQDLIYKYYPKYKRRRQRFYLYNGAIYFYNFLGFMNVGNEIQLMKLDTQDIVSLLNRCAESLLNKLLRKLHLV